MRRALLADRLAVPLVLGVSLIAGFGVADLTGLRWLGAIVLLIGGAWCAWRLWPRSGPAVTIAVAVVYVVAFIASHPLGRAIGSWLAVLVVAIVVAAFAYAVMRPTGSVDSTTAPPTSSTR